MTTDAAGSRLYLLSWHGTLLVYEPNEKKLGQTRINSDLDAGNLFFVDSEHAIFSASRDFHYSTSTKQSPFSDHLTARTGLLHWRVGSRVVNLQMDDQYLCADPHGDVRWQRGPALSWESFFIINLPEIVYLQDITAKTWRIRGSAIPACPITLMTDFQLQIGGLTFDLGRFLDDKVPMAAADRRTALTLEENASGSLEAGGFQKNTMALSYSTMTPLVRAISHFQNGAFDDALRSLQDISPAFGENSLVSLLTSHLLGLGDESILRDVKILWRASAAWETDWIHSLLPEAPHVPEAEILEATTHLPPYRHRQHDFETSRRVLLPRFQTWTQNTAHPPQRRDFC